MIFFNLKSFHFVSKFEISRESLKHKLSKIQKPLTQIKSYRLKSYIKPNINFKSLLSIGCQNNLRIIYQNLSFIN